MYRKQFHVKEHELNDETDRQNRNNNKNKIKRNKITAKLKNRKTKTTQTVLRRIATWHDRKVAKNGNSIFIKTGKR